MLKQTPAPPFALIEDVLGLAVAAVAVGFVLDSTAAAMLPTWLLFVFCVVAGGAGFGLTRFAMAVLYE